METVAIGVAVCRRAVGAGVTVGAGGHGSLGFGMGSSGEKWRGNGIGGCGSVGANDDSMCPSNIPWPHSQQ